MDVTTLLKDIVALKAELKDLRNKSTPMEEFVKLRSEMQDFFQRSKPPTLTYRSIVQPEDSGPMGLDMTLYDDPKTTSLSELSPKAVSIKNPFQQKQKEPETKKIPTPPREKQSEIAPTYAAATTKVNEVPEKLPKISLQTEDGFKTVSYKKKRRNNNIRGTKINTSFSRLKAALRVAYLYLSNVEKTTSTDDIIEYAKESGEEVLAIEEMQSQSVNCLSYKLTVRFDRLSMFLDASYWPSDVIAGRYFDKSLKAKINTKNG